MPLRLVSFSLLFPLLLACGCGGGVDSTLPVAGKVTVDGKPLTTGSVTFHPDTLKGNTLPTVAVGDISSQGEYKLATGAKEGVPAGWYKVTVNASAPSDPKDEYSEPRSLINATYNDAATSPLAVEVKADTPAGAYDLKLNR